MSFTAFLAASAFMFAVVAQVFASFTACVASLAADVAAEIKPFNVATTSVRALICPPTSEATSPPSAW